MPSVVVKVELFGVIRDLVKDTVVEIAFPDRDGVSYRDVMERMVDRFGPAFRERLYGPQGLLSIVKIYAVGKLVQDLDQALQAGDEPVVRIIVFAAAGGG
jgi:molybdopterin converting factor small subunit